MQVEELQRELREEPIAVALEADALYWQHQLEGAGRAAGLPLDRPRGAVAGGAHGAVDLALDAAAWRGLEELCKGNQHLLLVAFITAVKTCLYRLTGSGDIVVGTAIDQRYGELAALNRVLALRDRVVGTDSLKQLLLRVKETLAEAYAHQRFPFERLKKLRDGAAPLFRVAVVAEGVNETANVRYLEADLTLVVGRPADRPCCRLEHCPALDRRTVELFGGEMRTVLATLVARPDTTLDDLALPPSSLRRGEIEDRPPVPPAEAPDEPALAPVARSDRPALSFAQQRLWFLQQLEPESVAYNIPLLLAFDGALDLFALARSLDEVVRRHESLRTTFPAGSEGPFQRIHEAAFPARSLVDLTALPVAAREGLSLAIVREQIERPFDLTAGPLLRQWLIRLQRERHLLLWNLHHIVCDGWSLGVLTGELTALYRAFAAGRPSPLPPLPLQYADFAAWQRGWLRGENLARPLDFWRRQLAGMPPQLELPADRPRPAVMTDRGATARCELPAALVGPLAAVARREGATPFMVLLAAFKALLFRYTGQADLVVGTPIANRDRLELEALVGFFVNTLVLRTDLGGDPDLSTIVRRVRETAVAAYGHQELPFERLVEELAPERDPRRTPLFQVGFALQSPRAELALPGLTVRSLPVETGTAKFDLLLTLSQGTGGLAAQVEYSADRFDPSTVLRLLCHYRTLLLAAVDDPELPLSRHPLLGEGERWQLLGEWTGAVDDPPGSTLHERFAAQVQRTPDRLAVTSDEGNLSYGALEARANRLTHRLRGLGVGPDVLVGLCPERSLDLVVGVLGILKAGGAYLPLDPRYPDSRLALMREDSAIEVLVTTAALRARVPDPSLQAVLLDGEEDPRAGSAAAPEARVSPECLAYVIYTSGSTGRPKGTLIPHTNVTRLIDATAEWFDFGPQDVWTFFHSFAFDFSIWELWGALLHGGRLVVVSDPARRSPSDFHALLEREQVTVLNQTPSAFRQLAAVDEERPGRSLALRTVIFGGEALDLASLAPWLARHGDRRPRLVNMYGITETTVHVSYRPIVATDLAEPWRSPIGIAIPDLLIRLLDPTQNPSPIGVPGEIHVGGAGLARGYLGRPELTAERFVPDPFAEVAGARLYRSGDLARSTARGELEYLGRIDQQVKVRGYRIELGEIEATLEQCPGVRTAKVLLREDRPGDQRLVAYLVSGPGEPPPAGETLRSALGERLPEHMIPAAYLHLESLPLTANGKVDRRALPAPQWTAGEKYVAPRQPVEEILAGIFAEVLGSERIGVEDSFFALGGHSLLATQLVSRVRVVFAVELALREVFAEPTVAGLARRIAALSKGGRGVRVPPLLPAGRVGALQLSFAQQRIWFLHQMDPGSSAYNIPLPLRLQGDLRPAVLALALGEVAQRHEVLRTRFVALDGRPIQEIEPRAATVVRQIDLQALPAVVREREVRRLLREEARRPFDLSSPPLLRLSLVRLETRDWRALLVLHHIVADGWSLGVLMREVAAAYEAFATGRPSPLPELPVQYADFALWQRSWLAGEVLEEGLAYWRAQAAGSPALDLPTDRPRPPVLTSRGESLSITFPEEVSRGLAALVQSAGATLFMGLLAAFQALLYRYTAQARFNVGTPIAGRNQIETEGLIGCFVNTLVLRCDLRGELTFRDLLTQAREVTLAAYAHQEVPFEKLVEELAPERDLARPPLFQVMLALQNAPLGAFALPGLALSPLATASEAAKFELSLLVAESPTGISGRLEYRADLFDSPTIRRLCEHLGALLGGLVETPERRLSEVPLLLPGEAAQLLLEWNDTAYPLSRRTVHELFEEQAERTPEAVAAVGGGRALTYRELNSAANRLARVLRGMGVGPDARVVVCLHRSADLLMALLGVLKAGGAYVPLDPAYPEERSKLMLADSFRGLARPVLLTERALAPRFRPIDPAAPLAVILLDDGAVGAEESGADLNPVATPEHLAYVIYTSGSSGRPKGVMVHHRGLVNYLVWCQSAYRIAAGSGTPVHSSVGFDLTVTSLFAPLLAGRAVVCLPEQDGVSALAETLGRGEPYSLVKLTPSHLRLLDPPLLHAADPADAGGVGVLIVGGEALFAEDVALWRSRAPGTRIVNEYGPTETVVGCAVHEMPATTGSRGPVPIGRPIANARLYLLGRDLEPCPLGGCGEIYIGGHGVARGYLGRPELTAERFVPDPFAPPGGGTGSRLYRTGDLARRLPGGELLYLGRIDEQVKIRGFRIELGEIEAALGQHPAVREAAVLVGEDRFGRARLVAYVAPVGEAPPAADLRGFLAQRLPAPMVPAAFMAVQELPLTANGKVDRRALASLKGALLDASKTSYAAPRTELEGWIAATWQEVLGVARVGVDDAFFDLGGHSLALVEIHARLRRKLGRDIPLVDLFRAPTVAALARHLSGEDAGRASRQGGLRAAARRDSRRRRERRRQEDPVDGERS